MFDLEKHSVKRRGNLVKIYSVYRKQLHACRQVQVDNDFLSNHKHYCYTILLYAITVASLFSDKYKS